MRPARTLSYEELAYPQLDGALKEARAKGKPETLVVLELDPTDTA
jgi:hypothetical protein